MYVYLLTKRRTRGVIRITGKEFIPQGGFFCHYVNPVVLSLIVFGWLGQPVIAWYVHHLACAIRLSVCAR